MHLPIIQQKQSYDDINGVRGDILNLDLSNDASYIRFINAVQQVYLRAELMVDKQILDFLKEIMSTKGELYSLRPGSEIELTVKNLSVPMEAAIADLQFYGGDGVDYLRSLQVKLDDGTFYRDRIQEPEL
jgi:hypothetical protein